MCIRTPLQGQRNEFVVSPRKATGAPITDVTATSAFAAEDSPYSFAGKLGCSDSVVPRPATGLSFGNALASYCFIVTIHS